MVFSHLRFQDDGPVDYDEYCILDLSQLEGHLAYGLRVVGLGLGVGQDGHEDSGVLVMGAHVVKVVADNGSHAGICQQVSINFKGLSSPRFRAHVLENPSVFLMDFLNLCKRRIGLGTPSLLENGEARVSKCDYCTCTVKHRPGVAVYDIPFGQLLLSIG